MAYFDVYGEAENEDNRKRVHAALVDVVREKLGAGVSAGSEDEAYAWGALNGQVSVFQLSLGVATVNGGITEALDADIKTTIETVWPFYAAAWQSRNSI